MHYCTNSLRPGQRPNRITSYNVCYTKLLRNIAHILTNLLGNACKYTENGVVTLRSKLVGENENGCYVRIEVCDTGIGIDPVKLESIFEPFHQVDNSMSYNFV